MARLWITLRVGVIASDMLAIILAHALTAELRLGAGAGFLGLKSSPTYGVRAVLVAMIIVACGWQYGTYRKWALFGSHRVYPALLTVSTYGLVAVVVLGLLLGGSPLVPRTWLLAIWGLSTLLMTLSRLLWRQIAMNWQRRGWLVRNVLIAGANQHGIAVAQQLGDPAAHGRRVVGFLDDYQRPGTEILPGLSVVGHPSGLLATAEALAVHEVIIIAGALSWESQRLIAELVTRPSFRIDARISPTFYDLLTTTAEMSQIAYVPMLTLSRARLSGLNASAKRLLDLAISSTLLVALLPFWVWCAAVSRLRRVPMIAREAVLGFAGRQFEVIGLSRGLVRSPVLARLPAIWNVLKNDLSLVGPRPIRAAEVKDHERWLANLFAMRPGLTGLWRLREGEMPVEERVALDLYYVRNYSLTLDGQVLFNTVRQLVRRVFSGESGLARWEASSAATPLSSPAPRESWPGDLVPAVHDEHQAPHADRVRR